MSRATKAHKARLINAAFRLRAQHTDVADAARRLAEEFALSPRQAYRYLAEAAALRAPVPVVEPTVTITFRLPLSSVRALRAFAQRSGRTLGQVVTEALAAFLGAVRRG